VLQSALCPCTEQHPIPRVSSPKSKSQVQATPTERKKNSLPPSLLLALPCLGSPNLPQCSIHYSQPLLPASLVSFIRSVHTKTGVVITPQTPLHCTHYVLCAEAEQPNWTESRDGKGGKKKTLKRCIATRSMCHRVREGNAKPRQP
jgi:hypothetical protein